MTALRWVKSSYSGGEGNECVEMAEGPSYVAVRDTKMRLGPALAVAPEAFAAFLGGVKDGGLGRTA
ncbi:DUF397 domain-containing protein [Streptomyces spongiae]|uniref:DUF397 domain-containing protein n=2 Tax=Streptomyces spongiae TaxID=565072 RepID=A0A5N8XM70_9ACTN|nr:DUF397 domain-containing protein [Streptomyces spongiae]